MKKDLRISDPQILRSSDPPILRSRNPDILKHLALSAIIANIYPEFFK